MIVGLKFAVAALIIGAGASAQQFEVASIKSAAPDERRMFIGPGPAGGISVNNMTLKQMIQSAWHIMPVQISGGPAWIDSARYNVVAKPEKRPAPEESMRMLQALLKDRFQLVIHSETKEIPIYALVLARKDGKLGENLTESKEGGCTVPDPNQPPPLLRGGKLGCGAIMSQRTMNGVSVPMTELARSLSLIVGRMVIDKTRLTAKYDYTVEFTPDESIALPGAPPVAAQADSSKPTLFTALQEQLGLKLESQKGPVEVFVVDRAEKPSEN
jgi:uncharacterized protein (TIGR03435 family)